MKKICVFAEFPLSALDGYNVGRGGGQGATWLPQYSKSLESEKDLQIHWVIFDRNITTYEKKHCWNQTFHKIPFLGVSIDLLLCRWPSRLASRNILEVIKPDLIHCWGTENIYGSALMEFKGPSILSMQGIITACFKVGGVGGWRWQLFRYWEPKSISKASFVTTESQWGKNRIHEINAEKKIQCIEYGVNHSYYDVEWVPDPMYPRILFVGSLSQLKGIDILFEMLKKYPNRLWKMVFAGDGPLADSLRSLNDPSVELLGILKTKQVQHEMAKAWALVMSSRADTSPNVVKEARVIGLPVIGSPHGGHAEYIDSGNDGLLVAGEDPENWFQAINKIAMNFDLCRKMGTLNQNYFRDHFRPERTVQAFAALYRELV